MAIDIARVESAWADLQQALQGLSDEALVQPGVFADWSVKDILAHIAFWHENMVAVATGQVTIDTADPAGVDELNRQAFEERRGWTLRQAREELERTYRLALETIRRMPEIDPRRVEADTWDHYQEHAADIRAWRSRRGL